MQDIEEYLDLNLETARTAAQDPAATPEQKAEAEALVNAMTELDTNPKWGREKVVETLHKFYVGSLTGVLSKEAVQSRSLMRSAAMLHALADVPFTIKSATGFELNMGGEAALVYDPETATAYSFNDEQGNRRQMRVGDYQTYTTASAARKRTDAEGNVSYAVGEEAYGGSVPAPVQSLDAATVALSASGRTWDKLNAASNGNPYMHTIYDAFKLDANGFDVMNQEINKNWLDSSMEWSYLEETRDSTKEAMGNWAKEMNNRPQGELIDVSLEGPGRMMGYLLSHKRHSLVRCSPLA